MKVRIIEIATGRYVNGEIRIPEKEMELPSLQLGWRFNFMKHSKSKGAKTFILVKEETLDIIEGCLIFEMKNNQEPYMAYIELAPHNRGDKRRHEEVAGCLIAFASRLSFDYGEGPFRGFLAFHVSEEKEKDQIKLISHYSKQYNAIWLKGTKKMIIHPEVGEKLINKYLKPFL